MSLTVYISTTGSFLCVFDETRTTKYALVLLHEAGHFAFRIVNHICDNWNWVYTYSVHFFLFVATKAWFQAITLLSIETFRPRKRPHSPPQRHQQQCKKGEEAKAREPDPERTPGRNHNHHHKVNGTPIHAIKHFPEQHRLNSPHLHSSSETQDAAELVCSVKDLSQDSRFSPTRGTENGKTCFQQQMCMRTEIEQECHSVFPVVRKDLYPERTSAEWLNSKFGFCLGDISSQSPYEQVMQMVRITIERHGDQYLQSLMQTALELPEEVLIKLYHDARSKLHLKVHNIFENVTAFKQLQHPKDCKAANYSSTYLGLHRQFQTILHTFNRHKGRFWYSTYT